MLESVNVEPNDTEVTTLYAAEDVTPQETAEELSPTDLILEAVKDFTKVVKTSGKKVALLKETREELKALNDELLSFASGDAEATDDRDVYTVASEHKRVSAKENKLSQEVTDDILTTAVDSLQEQLAAYKTTL